MGQQQTAQFQEFVGPIWSQICSEKPLNISSLLSEEGFSLTYEQFLLILNEINAFATKNVDVEGKRLVFAVKRGTDSGHFWKATVQIAAVKYNTQRHSVETYRLLNLSQFLRVVKTLKCQVSAAEQSKSSPMTVTTLFSNLAEAAKECCICLERPQEVLLPCTHSFCTKCIENWSVCHKTCPICRDKLDNPDDSWVLSEMPEADEICREIQKSLMNLAEEKEQDKELTCTAS